MTTPDRVVVPTATYQQLAAWAACWQMWWSPAAVAYRANEFERALADRIHAIAHDLSAARDWTNPAGFPVGHAELRRRRYPWLHDPNWRCRHDNRHGQCDPCAAGHGPLNWRTGQPTNTRKDHAA
jgi:ABC-type nickel/cobalt efflux system permease component RcnA